MLLDLHFRGTFLKPPLGDWRPPLKILFTTIIIIEPTTLVFFFYVRVAVAVVAAKAS